MSRTRLTLAVLAAAALASLVIAASASAASAPTIEAESVSHITPTDATIEAQIDPGGLETTYEVWVGAYPECIEERLKPCESTGEGPAGTGAIVATIPASSSPHTISVDIATAWHELSPNSSYIYNVRSTSSGWAYEGSAYGEDKVFSTAPASPPSIESESVSNITQTDATLEAQINPDGLATKYEFWLEYAVCQNLPPGSAGCGAIAIEPRGEGQIAAGSTAQAVNTTLTHLQPNYSYTYWVVATNSADETEGPHQSFRTLPAPAIDAESVSGVTGNDPTLEAQINPESLIRGVHYQFQVVTNTAEYLPEFACPTEGFPAGTSLCLGLASQAGALPISGTAAGMQDQSVSLGLGSAGMTLQPGTTYHYRVIAARIVQTEDTIAWEPPVVYGADQTFTTPAEPPPLNAQTSGTDGQLPAIQSPATSAPHHRRHHRRHRRGLHQSKPYRARHSG